ncbi:hypothetical protein [Streptomyces sp. NPDC090080]|uniref:hypothetical protein n=1 Tax=Streptomyces sp. NPDC090080 TaxID=3365939 RepID=UPI0038073B8E
MAVLPEAGRVDVRATGQEQAVQPVQDIGVPIVRWERNSSRAIPRLIVAAR